MANWKRMTVAGLKREREAVVAKFQPELDRLDRLIAEFSPQQEGKSNGPDGVVRTKKAKASTSRSEAAKKMWETRRAKSKLDHEAHARAEARQSPGASLREAAAG